MIGKTAFFYAILINCLLFSAASGCLPDRREPVPFMLSAGSPDSGNTAYTYDKAGNTVSRTDAENVTVTYAYDALSRLTNINFPDSLQNITYGYDSGTYGIGKLTSVTDPAGITSFAYNALGQITQETRVTEGTTFETVYGYSASTADLSTLTYPSGTVLTYQRDADGRISGISADGQSIVSNVTYQPFGPVSGMTMGNLSVTRSFDQRYQVSGIAAGTVMNRTYTHDGAGNVRTISGITKPPVAPGTTDYSIPSGNSRLSQSTGKTAKTYTYDNTGKITSDGVRTFTYNQNGQLIRVTAGASVIAEYTYDGFSRRVKKTAGGTTVLYHYGYDGNLISETDGTGSPIRDYVYLNGEPAAMRLYGSNAGWYYFLNDHLGTPQKIVNASGSVVWEAGYMPFGEVRVLIADIENNLRFPGQYYDRETGLHYNRHRYYDPDTGRYLTPDPIGLDGGMNLYVYVDGNPVNWVDLWGLSEEQINEAYNWIKKYDPEIVQYVPSPTFVDATVPGSYDGAALPFSTIVIDTKQINNDPRIKNKQLEIIRVIAHEFLHAQYGFIVNQILMILSAGNAHNYMYMKSWETSDKYEEWLEKRQKGCP